MRGIARALNARLRLRLSVEARGPRAARQASSAVAGTSARLRFANLPRQLLQIDVEILRRQARRFGFELRFGDGPAGPPTTATRSALGAVAEMQRAFAATRQRSGHHPVGLERQLRVGVGGGEAERFLEGQAARLGVAAEEGLVANFWPPPLIALR